MTDGWAALMSGAILIGGGALIWLLQTLEGRMDDRRRRKTYLEWLETPEGQAMRRRTVQQQMAVGRAAGIPGAEAARRMAQMTRPRGEA